MVLEDASNLNSSSDTEVFGSSRLIDVSVPGQLKPGKIYDYDSWFQGVKPDVSLKIGRSTVRRWSERFVHGQSLPVRYARYDMKGDQVEISVSVDYNWFMKNEKTRFLTPSMAVGDVFLPESERKGFSGDFKEPLIVDLSFRLRFPLLGYSSPENQEQDNSVYIQFENQSLRCYYEKDFASWLKIKERLAESARVNPTRLDAKAMEKRLEELMQKEEAGTLSGKDKEELFKISAALDRELVNVESEAKQSEDEILGLRFEKSTVVPVVLSLGMIHRLLTYINENRILSVYLDLEIVDLANASGGVLKISGLNRVIEHYVPGLNIYFVGVRKDRDESRIFVAGRIREKRRK